MGLTHTQQGDLIQLLHEEKRPGDFRAWPEFIETWSTWREINLSSARREKSGISVLYQTSMKRYLFEGDINLVQEEKRYEDLHAWPDVNKTWSTWREIKSVYEVKRSEDFYAWPDFNETWSTWKED